GSRADNDDIAEVCLIDRVVEAETLGNLLIGGIPKDGIAAADQHGDVGDGNVKTIQQLLNVLVAVEIDVRVRVPVACQELLDPKAARRMARPDEYDVTPLVRNQLHPSQDERTHED